MVVASAVLGLALGAGLTACRPHTTPQQSPRPTQSARQMAGVS